VRDRQRGGQVPRGGVGRKPADRAPVSHICSAFVSWGVLVWVENCSAAAQSLFYIATQRTSMYIFISFSEGITSRYKIVLKLK
jgi:hypothetical protein